MYKAGVFCTAFAGQLGNGDFFCMPFKKSKLISAITVYTIGDILSIGVSGFLLIPIYLRFMTPDEYGLFSIITTTTTMLGVIMSLGFHSAVGRYYFDYQTTDKQYEFLSSIWLFQLMFAVILGIILLIWGKPLWSWLMPGIPEYPYFGMVLAIATCAFSSGIYSIWLRVQEKPYGFVVLQMFSTFSILVLMMVLLIWNRGGALGAVIAFLVSNLTIACLTFFMLGKRCKLVFDFKYIKDSLMFGVWMMVGTLGFFF